MRTGEGTTIWADTRVAREEVLSLISILISVADSAMVEEEVGLEAIFLLMTLPASLDLVPEEADRGDRVVVVPSVLT